MLTRRKFLQKSLFVAGIAPFTQSLANKMVGSGEVVKISILHTNDVHSHVDPFPDNHKRYAGKGGAQNRYNMIQKHRKENPNTLLFDCGDIFQGTPYFNLYGGELELKLMSKMGYDAATMGNHDFDNGMDGFLSVKKHANFPFVCSNYDFSETILNNHTLPYKIFKKEGVKIGVFGLGIELDGLVGKKLFGKTVYKNPIMVANEITTILRHEQQCDVVICLSHLGYSYDSEKVSDLKLAKATSGIDLILGGHTHTFMENAEVVRNSKGKEVLVNQVGWAGINLGKVDLFVSKLTKKRLNLSQVQKGFMEVN